MKQGRTTSDDKNGAASSRQHPTVLRPWTFLGGLAGTLTGLALAGAWAGQANSHPGFTRFHQQIAPEAFYYPTVSEMSSIVRSKCSPNLVLVLVGGNSINYGVGQPVNLVWTGQLQRELGGNYCVVNLAQRGSQINDGAAIIAEVLRRQYPRQILVTNKAPLFETDLIGSATYRYLLWEAYFKGWLQSWPPREARIRDYFSQEADWQDRWVLQASLALDSAVHYRDFWNWVGYEHFFTLATPLTPQLSQLLTPRKRFPDQEPDPETLPVGQRFGPEVWEHELSLVRAFSAAYYSPGPSGSWVADEPRRRALRTNISAALPRDLQLRTLVIMSQNSPFFRKKLTLAELARDNLAFADGVALFHQAGYKAFSYGPDFAEVDFADRTHLSISGGAKLSNQVAPEVRRMAWELGYTTEP